MKLQWIFMLLLPIGLWSQQSEQIIPSEIKKVKLFLTAGEMTHEKSIKLAKGRNKLVFSGISAFADPRSIQFTGTGAYRLVSVSTEIDFLSAEQFNPRIKTLKDSLETLKDRFQLNTDLYDSYSAELAVLNANKSLKGDNQNLTVEQLKSAAEYYRVRTFEINKQLSKITKDKRILNEQISETRLQLTELNYNENQRSNQVIILLDTDLAYSIDVILKYIVSDCGWAASYDLAATDLNLPINLKYKAQVYNNTGNDWKNVQLTLSTADPQLSASSPVLNPFYIAYLNQMEASGQKFKPIAQKMDGDYRGQVMNEINVANQRAFDNYVLEKDISEFGKIQSNFEQSNGENEFLGGRKVASVNMKQIQISELNAEFPIQGVFSCPADSKPYFVDIKEITIPATFSHVSVPKLDQGAFLLANIVGWQELDLIPGPTNVYFAGNYVGVSELDTRNVSDTLSLSFGRDPKIQVVRKLKSEMSTKKISGSTKRDTYYYETQLRNNRTVPVKIVVYDQVPLSRNSEITITTETIGTGVKDELTGEVKYELTLQPGATVTLELGYTVKYPKNQSISVKTFRTISAPSF